MENDDLIWDGTQWIDPNAPTSQKKKEGGWFASGGADLIGSVISILPNMTEQFNTGYQSNQLSIAQANARAAEANANSAMAMVKNNWPWILGIVIVIGIIILAMNRKPNQQ